MSAQTPLVDSQMLHKYLHVLSNTTTIICFSLLSVFGLLEIFYLRSSPFSVLGSTVILIGVAICAFQYVRNGNMSMRISLILRIYTVTVLYAVFEWQKANVKADMLANTASTITPLLLSAIVLYSIIVDIIKKVRPPCAKIGATPK
ncbi:MAG: hypothetical protein SFX18_17380 [Pirellulales bacterium]|nr:hypothetical protein [Pirellulales bacterium]